MPFIFFILLSFVSGVWADTAIPSVNSFAPPPSDLSVTYLSNIFGLVDGVLSGSGSQIFGRMMGVLNLIAIAFGSIIILYTMIVGTLNTAHEGQFLGQKWSKIWIPVRCSAGLALLIPKASGYSLIQIFVMWIVVQGVGAADKVWYAALSYLNQGGKIVQSQMSSSTAYSVSGQSNPVYKGASTILTGEVCMYGLQKKIENVRQTYLEQASLENPIGPCASNSAHYNDWQSFCEGGVPDFLSSVNAVDYQEKKDDSAGATKPDSYTLLMPNFSQKENALYYSLNGVCGKLNWNSLTSPQGGGLNTTALGSTYNMTEEQIKAINLTRAIAIQQMYENLGSVARTMVDNDPMLNTNLTADSTQDASYAASSQFGVTKSGPEDTCNVWNANCNQWGQALDNKSPAVLFSGNEFFTAINSYNTVMMPTLNLITQMNDQAQAQQLRSFIEKTETEGWMFAGSYFFNLVNLSGSPNVNQNSIDNLAGLDKSEFYGLSVSCGSDIQPNTLCWLMTGMSSSPNLTLIGDVKYLIDGDMTNSSQKYSICSHVVQGNNQDTVLSYGAYDSSRGYVTPNDALSSLSCSSTTLGFIGNTYFLAIPGQPGIQAPAFPGLDFVTYDFSQYNLKLNPSVPCNSLKIPIIGNIGCIFKPLLDGAVSVFVSIVNGILLALQGIATALFNLMVVIPLKVTIMPVLENAYNTLITPSINPIVSLANMGGYVIDATVGGYLELLGISVLGIIPYIGGFITVVMSFMMPLYTAWLAFFLGIGFLTAYYVPLLPYMIFAFGSIGWLINVIEAMVGAPLMALGMVMPEGEGILGKSEQGMTLMVSVFLRPALMIIGFVTGIALTFVSVWIINQGFSSASVFLTQTSYSGINWTNFLFTQVFARIFFIAIYMSIYLTVVQKSFNLIFILPDRILRWIGGHAEQSETAQWLEESKQRTERFEQTSSRGLGAGFGELTDSIKNQVKKGKDEGQGGGGTGG